MGTPTSTPGTSLSSSPEPRGTAHSPERASTWVGTLFKGVVNLVTILLIIYLTYHFTVFFATPAAKSRSTTEADKALVKKAEDLRAQDKKVMSSYGWVNPATRSVRIPVERAMELIAAESGQPAVTAAPAAPNLAATPAANPVAKASAPPVALTVPGAPSSPRLRPQSYRRPEPHPLPWPR